MRFQSFAASRREFLRGASVFSGAAVFGVTCRSVLAPPPPPDDSLMLAAIPYIDEAVRMRGAVVVGPVSLLQRHLSLGYKRAIMLAADLERMNVWTVYHNQAGERCAQVQIVRSEPAKAGLG